MTDSPTDPTPGPLGASAENELAKERTYGGAGVEVDRPIPVIDLADAVIAGPRGRYEPITAHDYLQQRIAANFAG